MLVLIIMAEMTLRMVWGFGKMPLYAESDKWEYMVQPNQHGVRLGNKYYYNSYGMRSEEVDSTKMHVLGLGDSVIYGGVQTDQDSLATTLFTFETGIQMLNISAGSWGPDNCAAYLREFGTFDAIGVFLLVSSHDAHDNMDFSPTVGVFPSYPDRQYPTAISEVICRYLWPRYIKKLFNVSSAGEDPDASVISGRIRKDGKDFNCGFKEIKDICDADSIPLIVYLHADENELRKGDYDEQGQEIAVLLATYNGAKYLVEQLDSLRAQTYQNFVCYIHDDGSNDGTQQIITDYCSKYPERFVYLGCSKTGGAKNNFMYLLRNVEADYYMFCDQDDVWLPEKIEKTYNKLKEIEEKNPGLPVGVCADVTCVDENLNVIVPSFLSYTGRDFRRTKLIDLLNRSIAPGCTMMFNHIAKEIAMSVEVTAIIFMHDWYMSVITSSCGQMICRNESLMLYRQHGNNTLGLLKKTSRWYKLFHLKSSIKEIKSGINQNLGISEATIICLEHYMAMLQSKGSLSDTEKETAERCKESLTLVRKFRRQLQEPYLVRKIKKLIFRNQ